MVRTMLQSSDGTCREGGEELMEAWHADTDSRLWLDLEGDPSDTTRELLQSLGCDDLAITDSFRKRHPPKVEHFADNTFILFRGISKLDNALDLIPQQIGLWFNDRCLITLHRGNSVSIAHAWRQVPDGELLARPAILALQILHYASGRYLERLLQFEDTLGDLEDGLLTEHSEEDMKELVAYRSKLRRLRRIFSYHQHMAEQLWENGGHYFGDKADESLHERRDFFDRCERLHSRCQVYYEISGDLIVG